MELRIRGVKANIAVFFRDTLFVRKVCSSQSVVSTWYHNTSHPRHHPSPRQHWPWKYLTRGLFIAELMFVILWRSQPENIDKGHNVTTFQSRRSACWANNRCVDKPIFYMYNKIFQTNKYFRACKFHPKKKFIKILLTDMLLPKWWE